MQCPQCGSQTIVEQAKFCADCGVSLSPDTHDTAASDKEQQPANDTSLLNQDGLRHNSFSEFYAGAETPRWRKRLLAVVTLAAFAAALAGGAYYYSHRKYEISDLAKLPSSTPTLSVQPTASKQDIIFPCPSATSFCIGTLASKIKDPVCNKDKPVWAHYSEDDGNTWKRAGCYATEAQARQGLSDTLGLVGPKTRLSETPKKTTEATSNKHKTEQAAKSTSSRENTVNVQQQHQVTFRGPFGIPVEKRTYPSAQMKQKALDLWERERKILEPDGSINDKYVVKQKTGSGLIPGH